MALETERRSPYRRFLIGGDVDFSLTIICPNGSRKTRQYHDQITAIYGGGFVGEVLVFRELPLVIKTNIPDAGHEFWRLINWGVRPFPPQIRERQAQLDHLSTVIMHDTVPVITGGKVYVPESYGYTHFDSGFAQGIERLHGRPPRYDNHDGEFLKFRKAQVEIAEVAYELGFEQVGQVHPGNRFAMANLWLNPKKNNRWEWFDTLSAIPHKGWVWPFYYFRFHKAIRERFYPGTGEVTFNRIHTNMLLKEVERQRGLFGETRYKRIHEYAELYDQLMSEREQEEEDPRDFATLFSAGRRGLGDLSRSVVSEIAEAASAPIRVLVDPKYKDRLILAGVDKAHDSGIISRTEHADAKAGLEASLNEKGRRRFIAGLKNKVIFSALYGHYFGSSILLKTLEIGTYTAFGLTDTLDRIVRLDLTPFSLQENWVEKALTVAGVFAGFRILGGAQSYLVTKAVGFLTGKNLETAARISAIPFLGAFLAVPAQVCVDAGSKGKLIWHYTVRNLVAKISKAGIFNPAGGWGSQSEGTLWERIGKWMESWAR